MKNIYSSYWLSIGGSATGFSFGASRFASRALFLFFTLLLSFFTFSSRAQHANVNVTTYSKNAASYETMGTITEEGGQNEWTMKTSFQIHNTASPNFWHDGMCRQFDYHNPIVVTGYNDDGCKNADCEVADRFHDNVRSYDMFRINTATCPTCPNSFNQLQVPISFPIQTQWWVQRNAAYADYRLSSDFANTQAQYISQKIDAWEDDNGGGDCDAGAIFSNTAEYVWCVVTEAFWASVDDFFGVGPGGDPGDCQLTFNQDNACADVSFVSTTETPNDYAINPADRCEFYGRAQLDAEPDFCFANFLGLPVGCGIEPFPISIDGGDWIGVLNFRAIQFGGNWTPIITWVGLDDGRLQDTKNFKFRQFAPPGYEIDNVIGSCDHLATFHTRYAYTGTASSLTPNISGPLCANTDEVTYNATGANDIFSFSVQLFEGREYNFMNTLTGSEPTFLRLYGANSQGIDAVTFVPYIADSLYAIGGPFYHDHDSIMGFIAPYSGYFYLEISRDAPVTMYRKYNQQIGVDLVGNPVYADSVFTRIADVNCPNYATYGSNDFCGGACDNVSGSSVGGVFLDDPAFVSSIGSPYSGLHRALLTGSGLIVTQDLSPAPEVYITNPVPELPDNIVYTCRGNTIFFTDSVNAPTTHFEGYEFVWGGTSAPTGAGSPGLPNQPGYIGTHFQPWNVPDGSSSVPGNPNYLPNENLWVRAYATAAGGGNCYDYSDWVHIVIGVRPSPGTLTNNPATPYPVCAPDVVIYSTSGGSDFDTAWLEYQWTYNTNLSDPTQLGQDPNGEPTWQALSDTNYYEWTAGFTDPAYVAGGSNPNNFYVRAVFRNGAGCDVYSNAVYNPIAGLPVRVSMVPNPDSTCIGGTLDVSAVVEYYQSGSWLPISNLVTNNGLPVTYTWYLDGNDIGYSGSAGAGFDVYEYTMSQGDNPDSSELISVQVQLGTTTGLCLSPLDTTVSMKVKISAVAAAPLALSRSEHTPSAPLVCDGASLSIFGGAFNGALHTGQTNPNNCTEVEYEFSPDGGQNWGTPEIWPLYGEPPLYNSCTGSLTNGCLSPPCSPGNNFCSFAGITGFSTPAGSPIIRARWRGCAIGCPISAWNDTFAIWHLIPQPSIDTAGTTYKPNDTVCANGSITIGIDDNHVVGNGGAMVCNIGYQWHNGSGSSPISGQQNTTYSPTATGTYSLWASYGCDNYVDPTSGFPQDLQCATANIGLHLWTVIPQPDVPEISVYPELASVCPGATLFLLDVSVNEVGSGCFVEYSTNIVDANNAGSANWTTPAPYSNNSFPFITSGSVGTVSGIRARLNCGGSPSAATGCNTTAWDTYTWNVVSSTPNISAYGTPNPAHGDTACPNIPLSVSGIVDPDDACFIQYGRTYSPVSGGVISIGTVSSNPSGLVTLSSNSFLASQGWTNDTVNTLWVRRNNCGVTNCGPSQWVAVGSWVVKQLPLGATLANPIPLGTLSCDSVTHTSVTTDSLTTTGSCYADNNSTFPGYMYNANASNDVFYEFTVNLPATVHISTCGSDFPTKIAVINKFSTIISAFTNADELGVCSPSRASVAVPITQGMLDTSAPFMIVVEGLSNTDHGNIRLDVRVAKPESDIKFKLEGGGFVNDLSPSVVTACGADSFLLYLHLTPPADYLTYDWSSTANPSIYLTADGDSAWVRWGNTADTIAVVPYSYGGQCPGDTVKVAVEPAFKPFTLTVECNNSSTNSTVTISPPPIPPPSGTKFYWQGTDKDRQSTTSPNGSNNFSGTSPFKLTGVTGATFGTATQYARMYNSAADCWSDSVPFVVVPPTPTITVDDYTHEVNATKFCVDLADLPVGLTADAGSVDYGIYWQNSGTGVSVVTGTTAGGSHTLSVTGTGMAVGAGSINFTAGTAGGSATYWARAAKGTGTATCWSGTAANTLVVAPPPPGVTPYPSGCAPTSLKVTTDTTAGAFVSYWQDNNPVGTNNSGGTSGTAFAGPGLSAGGGGGTTCGPTTGTANRLLTTNLTITIGNLGTATINCLLNGASYTSTTQLINALATGWQITSSGNGGVNVLTSGSVGVSGTNGITVGGTTAASPVSFSAAAVTFTSWAGSTVATGSMGNLTFTKPGAAPTANPDYWICDGATGGGSTCDRANFSTYGDIKTSPNYVRTYHSSSQCWSKENHPTGGISGTIDTITASPSFSGCAPIKLEATVSNASGLTLYWQDAGSGGSGGTSTSVGTGTINTIDGTTGPVPYEYWARLSDGDCWGAPFHVAGTASPKPTITTPVVETNCMTRNNTLDSVFVVVSGSGGTGSLEFEVVDINNNPILDSVLSLSPTSWLFSVPANSSEKRYRVTDGNACWDTVGFGTVVPYHPKDIKFTASGANTITSGCYVPRGNRWITFRSPDDANLAIVSINPGNNNLGRVAVTLYKEATEPIITNSLPPANCADPNTMKAMVRHFRITSENPPASEVGVRLYFSEGELQNLITATDHGPDNGDPCLAADRVIAIDDLVVTKYHDAVPGTTDLPTDSGATEIVLVADPSPVPNAGALISGKGMVDNATVISYNPGTKTVTVPDTAVIADIPANTVLHFSNSENGDYADNIPTPTSRYKVFDQQGRSGTLSMFPGIQNSITDPNPKFDVLFDTVTDHKYVQFSTDELSEFWLHGSFSGVPLPVTLIYVEAEPVNNKYILVRWATATEINNKGFAIERSEDGVNWSEIGFVNGNGNATVRHDYYYNDYDVVPGIRYYYRLKQIDIDDKYDYSDIVSAVLTTDVAFDIKGFVPNPAANSVTLKVTTVRDQQISVDFYDVLGRKVYSGEHIINKGKNDIVFDLTRYAAGTYTAIVKSGNDVYARKLDVIPD